jgi:membrane associated rhomboid family serine protease
MSQRFLIYPVLFIALGQLVPLLRGDCRWHAAQIAQLFVTLLACLGGIYFEEEFSWVPVAWTLLVLFVVAPAVLSSVAARMEQRGEWGRAAFFRRLASWVIWGWMGRLYRRYAAALQLVAGGYTEEALQALEDLSAQPMPLAICGIVRTWKLSLLVTLRRWEQAVAYYESVYDWGALGLATQGRLFAARAFAETGQIGRALRSLQFVMLSPRTLGAKQTQLWATRVCVAALAGDAEGVEELLGRREYARRSQGFKRFAAYWLGRCAVVRGEHEEAVRLLTRAYELTRLRNQLWRQAIAEQLRRAENVRPPHLNPLPRRGEETASLSPGINPLFRTSGPGIPQGERRSGSGWWAAQDPVYAHGQELLRRAEKDTAAWRALMHMGQPELVTLTLLLLLAMVHLTNDVFLRGEVQDKLLLLFGNSSDTVREGEWWRAFTALFLHANLLHLAMNGVGLWLFGSAVEKTMGRWRLLVVFLLGGALGNLASAFVAHYDVAIGASGGIFAVIGAFGVGVWRLRSPMYITLRRRLLVILMLMVATDFTIGGLEPQVDNLAHVGGFFSGILLAVALWPRGREEKG